MAKKDASADIVHQDIPSVSPRSNLVKTRLKQPRGQSYYQYHSIIKKLDKSPERLEGREYVVQIAKGFNLQKSVNRSSGPIIEIGGPSSGGYYFLENISLPSKPIITNLRDSLFGELGKQVDQLVDGQKLPYDDSSVGIVLMQHLDFIKEDSRPLEQAGHKKLDYVKTEMDLLAAGEMDFEQLEYSLRASIYPEVWRVLSSGGLFFTDGYRAEQGVLEKLGFETVSIRKEKSDSTDLIDDLILRKS